MEVVNDADAAALRREARRRRILQNSDDRLRKIKGHSEEEIKESAIKDINNGHIIPDITNSLHLGVNATEPSQDTHLPDAPIWSQPLNTEEELFPQKELNERQQQTSIFSKFFHVRIHIILLAIVVRILLQNDFGYLFGEMALVPLLLVLLTELLMPGTNSSAANGGLLGAALMLSGFTQSKAHGLLHVVCWLRNASTNLAIYLFSFFLAHIVLQVL